jgi:hypothetical protein
MAHHTVNACVACGGELGDGSPLCELCEAEASAPAATVRVRDRVKAYLPGGSYCHGWAEVIEATRIGVRLVNGNFRWCKPSDVKADRRAEFADSLNGENLP